MSNDEEERGCLLGWLLAMMFRLQCALLSAGLLVAAAGCGSPGSPQPPSLRLPEPAADLSAGRSGDTVTLHWTMPRRATDRVLLAGDQRAVICRAVAAASCSVAGELLVQPGLPATWREMLPEALRTGDPRLLTYTVLLQNHRRQSAGSSNAAYAAAGAAPPTIRGLRAEASGQGIVLRWEAGTGVDAGAAQPTGAAQAREARFLRLDRTRVLAPGESAKPGGEELRAGVPQPVEQTLEVPEASTGEPSAGWALDHAIDKDAALNRTYRYTVERIGRLSLEGHAVEVSSAISEPAWVNARDLFAPAVPTGLEAVADPDSGAIDLSWTADSESDLAGYVVYRRVVGGSGPPVRVSGAALLVDPAWRDMAAKPGMRYAYSVSASDTTLNESARSKEAEESVTPAARDTTLPASPPAHPQP